MNKVIISLLILLFTFNTPLFARDIDINSIVKNSVGTDKYLFIFLHRTDCGYCESMLTFTLDDDPVKELISKDFVYLHINISEDDLVTYKKFSGNGRAFAKYVGYNIYPSSLFLNSKNEIVHAVAGYQNKEDFLETLKYVKSATYKAIEKKSNKKPKTALKKQ